MAVASSEGGNRFIEVSVRPMNGGRKPLANAFLRVDIAGENRAACANSTRSACVLVCRLIAGYAVASAARFAVVFCSCVLVGVRRDSGNVHRPWLFLGHVRLVPLGMWMVQRCWSNVTWHPLSHSGATANRELCSSGKIWVVLACLGSPVIGSSAVWVECMYS